VSSFIIHPLSSGSAAGPLWLDVSFQMLQMKLDRLIFCSKTGRHGGIKDTSKAEIY
jgi:hypothetical protein